MKRESKLCIELTELFFVYLFNNISLEFDSKSYMWHLTIRRFRF